MNGEMWLGLVAIDALLLLLLGGLLPLIVILKKSIKVNWKMVPVYYAGLILTQPIVLYGILLFVWKISFNNIGYMIYPSPLWGVRFWVLMPVGFILLAFYFLKGGLTREEDGAGKVLSVIAAVAFTLAFAAGVTTYIGKNQMAHGDVRSLEYVTSSSSPDGMYSVQVYARQMQSRGRDGVTKYWETHLFSPDRIFYVRQNSYTDMRQADVIKEPDVHSQTVIWGKDNQFAVKCGGNLVMAYDMVNRTRVSPTEWAQANGELLGK
ncbi:MAG: hypothetical protein JXR97_02735 [Planctomycetes bacterium]|nr:hypothetical protein [Planctomycetota bacterium]